MQDQGKKNKHLTLEDRIEIQECLCKGMTFKAIGKRIAKDPTTVSKEVKLHAKAHDSSFTKTTECCPKLLKAPFVCNGCENLPCNLTSILVLLFYTSLEVYTKFGKVSRFQIHGVPAY